MTGRRVYSDGDGNLRLAEGDYGKDGRGIWVCRPPGCHAGDLSNHTVSEHEDGTITVSPSILLNEPGAPGWHGFLERGIWRGC